MSVATLIFLLLNQHPFFLRDESMPVLRSQGTTSCGSFHIVGRKKKVNQIIHVVQPYEWRGFRQTRGIRSKAKRVLTQFSPHDFTAFKWGTATDFLHFSTVVLLLAVFLAAELNPFYLKVREKKAYIIDYLIKAKAIFHLRPTFFSLRACCGWNRIILLSF